MSCASRTTREHKTPESNKSVRCISKSSSMARARPTPLLLGEKGAHRGQKLLGLLHRWRVPTVVDDVQRRVGQRVLVQLATIDRNDGILLAPDNERGGCDAAQIAGQVRVVKVGFPAQA